MSNSLLIYLNKRMANPNPHKMKAVLKGPVITISREVGCNGIKLAKLLTTKLNTLRYGDEWKVLSKEVFYESARELNMHPEQVQKVFKQVDKFSFDEILKAFNTKNYKSERKIAKTVIDIIYTFAADGYCVIVGRAGHIIARDIPHAIHLRLVAPLEYRVENIMENNRLSRRQAIDFIELVERERKTFRKTIRHENLREELFDLTINRATYTDEQLVDLILYAIEKKKVLDPFELKVDYF